LSLRGERETLRSVSVAVEQVAERNGLRDSVKAASAETLVALGSAGGEDNNPDYYAAARGPKQLWKIDTSHTHGLSARPAEYERRVVGFFDRTLSAD
jgi:hypothetical protein